MNEEIKKYVKREVKELKESIISQELEIGKHNTLIQGIEATIKNDEERLKRLGEGLRKEDKKAVGLN